MPEIRSCPSEPLLHVSQAGPLRLQRCHVGLHVEVLYLNFTTVHHKHHVLDGDGGFGNVGGNDHLPQPLPWPVKDVPLPCGGHETVERVDDCVGAQGELTFRLQQSVHLQMLICVLLLFTMYV